MARNVACDGHDGRMMETSSSGEMPDGEFYIGSNKAQEMAQWQAVCAPVSVEQVAVKVFDRAKHPGSATAQVPA